MSSVVRSARIAVREKGSSGQSVIFGGDQSATPSTRPSAPSTRAVYDAASTKRRSSAWGGVNGGPNVPMGSLTTLRNRARDAVRNIGVMDSAVATIETNVVGTGIKPQFTTTDSGLNKELGELWREWTLESDPSGQLSFYGQQQLSVRSTVEAGEMFGRLRIRGRSDGLSVPLQVQLMEGEHCPVEKTEQLGGNHIIGGIEFTPFGKRAAYWMYAHHPSDTYTRWDQSGGMPRRIPAEQIFHMMQVRRIGQVRGEPWLARALVLANELHILKDAEMVRKKIAAMLVAFRRRPVPESMSLEELAEKWGQALIEQGIGQAVMHPGSIVDLEPGEDIQISSPADVGGNFEVFIREINRSMAASVGVLYEQLTGDYGNLNDRTLRAAINEFRRRCAMWQHHMVAFQMCRPVHQTWIRLAVLSKAIRPPYGMSDRDLRSVKWVPQGWPYIHPVQDVEATNKAIRGGLTSRAEAVSQRGDDVEAIDAAQAKDNARADQLGLSHDSDGRRAPTDPTKTHDTAGDDNAA